MGTLGHLIVVTLHAHLWLEMPQPQTHAGVQLQTLCTAENKGAVEAMTYERQDSKGGQQSNG
jgi:hypothetical protein